MSDSYNPLEKRLEATRGALKLIRDHGFGISLETKGTLVCRDIDLFQKIAVHKPVLVKLTITAADDALARQIEPHAPSSSQRFQAVRELSASGVCCGVLFTPTLPFITDTEDNIRAIVAQSAAAGARFIFHSEGVTLRDRQRAYFYEKLAAIDPNLPVRYATTYGDRYSCTSPQAKENRKLFQSLCKEQGLLYRMADIIKLYRGEEDPKVEQPPLF